LVRLGEGGADHHQPGIETPDKTPRNCTGGTHGQAWMRPPLALAAVATAVVAVRDGGRRVLPDGLLLVVSSGYFARQRTAAGRAADQGVAE
jgi:hypothetical protein